jgi:hypothetical protein
LPTLRFVDAGASSTDFPALGFEFALEVITVLADAFLAASAARRSPTDCVEPPDVEAADRRRRTDFAVSDAVAAEAMEAVEAMATAEPAVRWLRELADLDLAETGVCCAAILDFRGDLDFREPRTAAVAMMKLLVRDSDRRPFNNRPNHSNRSPYFPQDGFPNNRPRAECRRPLSAAAKAVFREKRSSKNVFTMPEILGVFWFFRSFTGDSSAAGEIAPFVRSRKTGAVRLASMAGTL